MSSYIDNAFPAGYESDASNEEWDIGACSDIKSPKEKILDAVVPEATDDVSKLKRAIYAGDIDTVEQLLDNGMDVETRLGLDWTPLMCAVSVANCDIAKLLLDRGASANFSKDHWTVLMASCTSSASEEKLARCVELLLSRNADPNMANRSQMTCLMLAARDGYSKIINLLVSHGADINFKDNNGYTALSLAVQYGREEAVLKLLQLGADKTLRTKAGKSPADLAVVFKHAQIGRILASSSHISTAQAFSSMEDTLSKFFKTNSDPPLSKESSTKLDELELLLHGLDLGYLIDIMIENNITWSYLLTMEKEDMEKIGIKDPEDQKKVLNAVQQMHLDRVDLDTLNQLGAADSGEELLNFLISVRQQCCYLTETVHDVISRFPRHSSQLVFSLDPNKDAQAICNQLIIQTNDMQKEVYCLRNLLCQMEETEDDHHLPQRGSISNWRLCSLTRMALSMVGAAFLLLFYKAAGGKVNLQMYRSVC
ncbi:ankyrin repeat, SAM and basic leucine zipper domain-containing protein 1 isoform X2 [Cheilinus undulatus]|uniref:ankyrin repeat, SAM and basic leucine zipper domain-containing protein 1 isoform X2 n=1 Tax=Cheilinus undulatus TaxID=241271 RepID=UPI001BD2CAB3|nr:ankyrin repeat, SAM and basic leucine zipper domain-containing protein 1 isoform X2 [Cheilinus undulatus]